MSACLGGGGGGGGGWRMDGRGFFTSSLTSSFPLVELSPKP